MMDPVAILYQGKAISHVKYVPSAPKGVIRVPRLSNGR